MSKKEKICIVSKSSSCRICLAYKKPLCPLFKYKLSGNYAEMLTAIANVKVAVDDGLPDKICQKCCNILEKAYLLKTLAERTDKKLRRLILARENAKPTKKITFDSLTDIKSEVGPLDVKKEPKWEFEVDIMGSHLNQKKDAVDNNIVIANTVIRKVEKPDDKAEIKTDKDDFFSEEPDITWNKKSDIKFEEEEGFADNNDNFFQDDDDNDHDYVPPVKEKVKIKKAKLTQIVMKKGKVVEVRKETKPVNRNNSRSTLITCYPVLKSGDKGQPILLRRPKDLTVLKHSSLGGTIRPVNVKIKNLGKISSKTMRVKAVKPEVYKQKEKMVCPVCGILTFSLGNHMNTHQEKKKYSCQQCNKTFAQKSNLRIHMKHHTGIKDHVCEICGAAFYCQKGLMRHNLIHKGERPFGCTLCTKRFIARCDLNRHMRIHSGYKPYKCSTCTMSFNAKHQLQNHERMHTGERPYICQVCNVSFSYKVNLNNHVFKVHGVNLKFKSIHNVTEEILRRELESVSETNNAIRHILPTLSNVPAPAAHETVIHTTEYDV